MTNKKLIKIDTTFNLSIQSLSMGLMLKKTIWKMSTIDFIFLRGFIIYMCLFVSHKTKMLSNIYIEIICM